MEISVPQKFYFFLYCHVMIKVFHIAYRDMDFWQRYIDIYHVSPNPTVIVMCVMSFGVQTFRKWKYAL